MPRRVLLCFVASMFALLGLSGSAIAQEDIDTQDGEQRGGIGGTYTPRGRVDVAVELNPEIDERLSPNYIPIIVQLTDPETGEQVEMDYVVLAGIANLAGQRATEVYSFAYPYLTEPDKNEPGIYSGVVIVPSNGQWKVHINAFDPIDERDSNIPTALGTGELLLNITNALTLESASQFGVVDELPTSNVGEVVLLIVHSGLGLSWFIFAAIMTLIATPQRRRWFSTNVNDFLDRRLYRFLRVLIGITALIWLTGILNLNILVAYPPPLTSEQTRALFLLPYAEPYTIALYLKIAVYGLITLLIIPLARAARRSVLTWRDGQPDSVVTADDLELPAIKLSWMARVSVLSIAAGGVVILVCVTILKYTHVLSESIRSVSP